MVVCEGFTYPRVCCLLPGAILSRRDVVRMATRKGWFEATLLENPKKWVNLGVQVLATVYKARRPTEESGNPLRKDLA